MGVCSQRDSGMCEFHLYIDHIGLMDMKGDLWKEGLRMKLLNHRRGWSAVVGILLLSMILAACGSSNTGSSSGSSGGSSSSSSGSSASGSGGKGCKKVGVLLPETASSARWDSKDKPALTADIAAAIPGAQVLYNNASGDPDQQQTQAEADISNGACILVVAPADSQKSAAIVAKAKVKGIPVIAYDRLIYTNDLNYYVSFDNEAVGNLQGKYIVDHYKDYTASGNNAVMINGAQTDNNALLFKQGALSQLQPLFDKKTLNLKYNTFTPNWDNPTAQTEMEGALTSNGNNIQIAYVANDGMANNVIAALKAHKLNKKVLVTGQDATVAGIQNILTGDQAMTVYKAIDKEAKAAADLVGAISNGTSTDSLTNGKTVKIPVTGGTSVPSVLEQPVAVDKTNINDTVIKDGFVTKADACKGLPAGTGGVC